MAEMAEAKAKEEVDMAREKKKYSYDSACEDLAKAFLEDDRAQIKEEEFDGLCCDLAQEIQQVIEDFISVERVGERWKQEGERRSTREGVDSATSASRPNDKDPGTPV